jgi:hypothetical protein
MKVVAYVKYLQKLSKAIGSKLGQSSNTGKFAQLSKYTVQDMATDALMEKNELNAMDEAGEEIASIFAGEREMSDEELLAAELEYENESEKEAENAGIVSKVVGLFQKKESMGKEVSEAKSKRIVDRINKKIEKTEQKIKDLINSIVCP